MSSWKTGKKSQEDATLAVSTGSVAHFADARGPVAVPVAVLVAVRTTGVGVVSAAVSSDSMSPLYRGARPARMVIYANESLISSYSTCSFQSG